MRYRLIAPERRRCLSIPCNFSGQPKSYNKHRVELDGTLLNGVFTIKDGISGGYPFLECILSVLPFCDKLLLNDGGSTDGTKECLQKLQRMFPNKIDLYYIRDKFTKNWGSIDFGLNQIINNCKSEWIFEIQGDEVLDPENAIKMMKELTRSPGYNAIRHSRLDCNFACNDDDDNDFFYDMRTVRLVRNIPDLSSYIGGDNFQIGPHSFPREGYTLHNVPPERDVFSFVLKHYIRCFPGCVSEWSRRHAVDLASDNSNRISIYSGARSTKRIEGNKSHVPSHVPEILRDLIGLNFYGVRDCLFDKGWLSNTTGLDYRP